MATATLRMNSTASMDGNTPLMQQTFTQNALLTLPYETLPLSSHMPGYTGFQPGKANGVVGQRAAAASLHTKLQAANLAANPHFQHMCLVDLRPEQRAQYKIHMYAETTTSQFLKFPTKKQFDHRRL